jgi:xylulokinase
VVARRAAGRLRRHGRVRDAGVYVAGVLAGLSGADAFIDRTYLHFTGVADARSASWSPELLEALGLDGSKLPRIVASDALIGELTASAAERCGLSPGIPIAAGLGDTAAGALGAGMVRAGQLLDTAGTAAVLVGGVDAFSADPEQGLIVMAGALPDQWLPLNYVAGGGLALPWLAALAAGTGASGADRGDTLAALLDEAAEVPPGADGLAFIPHLEGRIAPHAPAMRGGFLGLSLAHGRAQLARAILEAVAFEYATYLRAMRRLHPAVEFASARSSAAAHAAGCGTRSRPTCSACRSSASRWTRRRRAAPRCSPRPPPGSPATSVSWPRPCPRPRSSNPTRRATSATPRWWTATTASPACCSSTRTC